MKALITIVLILTSATASAERILPNTPILEFEALVVGIVDGDTVDIYRPGYEQARCRLASIDAPERGQAFGQNAKQALSDLIYKKTVLVGVVDKENRTDRANRLICTLQYGSMDVNGQMISLGLAWYSRGYLRDPAYVDREKHARSAGIGLWGGSEFVYPGDHRRKR